MGNKERAVPILENVIARDPQNVEAYGRLSDIYAAMGQAEKAQAIQEKLVGLQPNNPKFFDYLYTSFTNASAFSPTDVMPLTRWAKMLMLVQSMTALLIVGLVIARAVNILH